VTPAPRGARIRWPAGLVLLAGLGACVSKGDVQMVQAEVSLLKAETARRDSAQAAQLSQVIRMQQAIMDSLTGTKKALGQVKGDVGTDLYNIQQQLVQLQELTGQSQQRLNDLRNQMEVRRAEIQSAAPGDSAQPQGQANASADAMYEASLAQLRKGSNSTGRAGLREMLKTYPTSSHAADALYFIGQSFSSENPDSAASYYQQVVDGYASSPRAGSALYNLGLLAERRKDTATAKDAYTRVTQKYPQSDEAALARDRLKALGR
jgi:tol-pal system protein YbgF